MQKVLIICPFTSPNQGGVESHLQKLTSYISEKGGKTILVSYQPLTTPVKAPFYEKNSDYEIYRMPSFGVGLFPKIEHNPLLTFLYLVPGLFLLSFIVGIFRRREIGVIHAHGFAAGFIGLFLGALLKKRRVISTHAIYNFDNRPLLAGLVKKLLLPYDFVLAVGQPSLDELVRIGIPKNKLAIHPNWIDTNFFKPSTEKKRKTKQVIFVGRGLEKKGIFLFGELAKKNPQINFVARVGDGPDLDRFIQKYSSLSNLSIRTNLPPNFDEKMEIIRSEYQDSDIFLMPSLYPEGFASVVLEASSSGLATISSNLGCLPDMLGSSGAVLIEPTLQAFNKALHDLTSIESKLILQKQKIREFALKHFSQKNAQIIYNSYKLK